MSWDSCTLPVLHCTEVSQQTVAVGRRRRITHVRVMSASPPVDDTRRRQKRANKRHYDDEIGSEGVVCRQIALS